MYKEKLKDYESPTVDLLKIKFEGIICGSPKGNFDGKADVDDGNSQVFWQYFNLVSIMKKIYCGIVAFAVIIVGCAKVNEIETNLEKTYNVVTLHASVPSEEGTKVTTNNAGTFLWQASDKITVLNTTGDAYEFTAAEGGASTDFSSTTFTGTLSEEAFYPASANHTSGKFYLEPSITWAENASMMPMLGTVNTSTKEVSFRATGAVLKLVCYNVDKDADKLVVTSASKKIVGQFTPSDGTKAISASDSDENKVLTINFETAGEDRTMVFYIPLPIGDVGILTFTLKKGNTKVFEKETNGSVILTQNKMLVAPALNCENDILVLKEEFSATGSSTETVSTYNGDKEGQTVYSGSSISYSIGDNSNTVVYQKSKMSGTNSDSNYSGGAAAGELFLAKVSSSKNGTFVISGIPATVSKTLTLTFMSNQKTSTYNAVSSVEGVTLSSRSEKGEKPYKISYQIKIANNYAANDFSLTFTNSGSSNTRIDDIYIFSTPVASGAAAIEPASSSLSIDVASGDTNSASTTFTYSNPIDVLGVACSVNSEASSWLSAKITGSGPYTLTVTAPKNPGVEKRDGKVTLRATGVSKTISVTQPGSKVATPTFSVNSGTYGTTQSVELNCATAGATIRYTTDGTTPNSESTIYSSAISVSSSTTIKAIALKSNYTTSEVATATYTISAGAPNTYSCTFTTSGWGTADGSDFGWSSVKAGAGFSNNGIQVTKNGSGANANTNKVFTNVSQVVVTYNTNTSAGDGTLDLKIGTNDAHPAAWAYSGSADGRTANFTCTFNVSPTESGVINLKANTTTNSIYIVSVDVYATAMSDPE